MFVRARACVCLSVSVSMRVSVCLHNTQLMSSSRCLPIARRCCVAGSIPEREGEKLYNTCTVYNPEGDMVAKYRKVRVKVVTE